MKKKIMIVLMLMTGISSMGYAQKYLTKNGHISFYSEAPLENIEAHNKQVNCAYNAETGDFVFKVLMKSFEFEQALMQEHFNENYVNSSKFPNATFVGKVVNSGNLNLEQPGEHKVTVKGDLSIHGETQEIETAGTFNIKDDVITGTSVFNIIVDDYGIKIPSAVMQNISNSIEITVDVEMKKFESLASN